MPPTKDDWPKLLRILGTKSATKKLTTGKPLSEFDWHLRYNAFRWLRDAGFQPVTFALENQQLANEEDIREGLRAYEGEQVFYAAPMPGILSFAKPQTGLWSLYGRDLTWVLSREGQWITMSACSGLVVLGLVLCKRATTRNR